MECENCKGTNFSLEKWAWGYSRGGLRLIRSMLVCNCCGTRRVREYANESKLSEAFPDIDIMQYMGNSIKSTFGGVLFYVLNKHK